jgi:hypothetical protein
MRFAVSLAVLSLAMAIAGSAQTPAASSSGINACTWLTKEEAAAALGEAVTGQPKSTSMAEAASCSYSGSGIHEVTLTVMALTAANAGMYKAMCAKKNKDGLTGLGGDTCWYNDKHAELHVLKGMTFFSIQLRRSGDPTEAIKAAARKVYERVK